jgi:tetratricopeptide (TPR) repeat protein
LHAFNSGEETLKNQEDAFREMQNFVKVAPLEACTKLNRLDDFRHWLVPDAEKNDDITSQITSRMLHTLKDGIFSNITNLLELQLLFTGWEHLVASARDWYDSEVAVNSPLHPVSETKHWARLCTEFEQLYHLNGGAQADSVVTQYMNSIYLHTAKVARRQGNMLLAEKLIEKAAQAPDTKYRALYERTKILFSQSAYAEAMDTLNTIMTHVASVPEYKELASRTYRNIARYLKSSPEDKATSLLEKLDPNFVKRVATEMQSPVEACIDNALEKSIETNTTDGRPWFEYATHHYKQGWRILEEILQPEPTIAIAVWAKAEIQKNLTYADDTVDKKQLEKVQNSLEKDNITYCLFLDDI